MKSNLRIMLSLKMTQYQEILHLLLADGNVLPDGLKLSYARISGTPKKAGTYTVVFDVTDNGADMEFHLWHLNQIKIEQCTAYIDFQDCKNR